jgi:hypothetical protein
MTSSGTTTFNMPIDDIIRRAYSRFGQTSPSGYDMRQAMTALNLILQDLANRNVLLFTTERAEFTTASGAASYVLPQDTIDVQDVMSSDGYLEIPLMPFSQGEYQRLPLKTMAGRPTSYFSDRNVDNVTLMLWPVPDRAYVVSYYKIRRIQDVGDYQKTLDVPVKYLPAIISGLTWSIADETFKTGPIEMNASMRETERLRRDQLRQRYEEEVNRVIDEDRTRVSMFILPDLGRR